MKRIAAQPLAYASLDELQRGLLHHVRRFRRAYAESAAGPITLNAAPPKPASGKHRPVETLDMLRDQVVLLKNMSAQIVVSFSDNPKADAVRRRVDDLARDIEARADALRRDLSNAARKQVARDVVSRNHALIASLRDDLGSAVKSVRETYLVADITPPGTNAAVPADVAYAVLEELRGPDGYVHPSYFIATAHPRVKSTGGRNLEDMYVSVGPEFRTPGRLRWDASARNPRELRKIASDLLVRDGVIGKAFTRDVPVPRSRIRFVHDNVKRTTVRGDQIEVRVKDPKTIDQTLVELRGQLAGIVRQVDPRNRDLIRYRLDRGNGVIRFVFSLPHRLRGRLVDRDVMNRLRQLLNLSETEAQRVKTALENPE
jgi:hypothetical protein